MAISQERHPETPANPAERQPSPPGSAQLPPISDEQAPSAGMSVLHMFLWLREDNKVLREENRAMREENNQRHDETNRRLDETNRRLDDLRKENNQRHDETNRRLDNLQKESNQRHEETMKKLHQHDKHIWGVYTFLAVLFVSDLGLGNGIGQFLLSLFGAR